MTEPSKERIAAALALADAVDRAWPNMNDAAGHRLDAYRATAPKEIRTRGEVDAELNQVSSHMAALLFGPGRGQLCWGAAPGERDNFRTHTDIDKLMRLRDRWEELRSEPVTDDAPEQDELTEARAKIAELEERIERGIPNSGYRIQWERAEAAEARVKELERARDSLIDTGATLRADNERFARELLEARNDRDFFDAERMKAPERLPPRHIPEDDLVPVERCSCEEAEELRTRITDLETKLEAAEYQAMRRKRYLEELASEAREGAGE